MKRIINEICAIIAAAMLAYGAMVPAFADTKANSFTAAAVEENEFEQKVFDLVNAERDKSGLPALNKTAELIQDARTRSVEAVSVFSHTRPNGSNWWELDPANMYSECLCWREPEYGTPEGVVEAWMRSKSHRECLLRKDLTAMGIGGYIDPATGRVYVTFEGGFTN